MDFFNRLQLKRAELTDNQFEVAKKLYPLIKENNLNITDASKTLNTSSSTISKIIRKLEYSNYKQFVIDTYTPDKVDQSDNNILKIKQYYNELINKSMELIDEKLIQEVVKYIERANKIIIIGIGNSGISADELGSRLERMGYLVKAITDTHRMQMQSTLMNEEDLIIAISNSGETISVNSAMENAKNNKVMTIGITNNKYNHLAQMLDLSVVLSSYKNVQDNNFINSQIPIIFFFDVLCYELLQNKDRQDTRNKTLKVLQKNRLL